MIELKRNKLVFQFDDVHPDAVCEIEFQRTLRIPDDNREYPLPPGLGRFPLQHVEDHAARLPSIWNQHGGVLLPMYQAEAMWLSFSSPKEYPFAVKIAAGKINALTGDKWTNGLRKTPQDYLVLPDQPWLDGFCVQKGLIRQFVAMPLGAGYTAEEQLTGTAEHGGLQIMVYPMKREIYEQRNSHLMDVDGCAQACPPPPMEFGLAPGGLMRQEIYEDDYGYDAWDMSVSRRCFVHILNSTQWKAATGKPAPGKPPSAADYTNAGLPWFEYYDDKHTAVGSAPKLAGLDSVAAKGIKLGQKPLPDNNPITPTKILKTHKGKVSDGNW